VPLAAILVLAIKVSIAVTVLGLGLSANAREAMSLFRDPPRLFWSLVAMMLIMPLFAILVARTFDLELPVKIALVSLSVSPVPPIWPKRSMQSGGTEEYTIGLLVATAILSIGIIPITIEIAQSVFSIPLSMSPLVVAKLAFVTILAPLFAGIAIRLLWSRGAARVSGRVVKVGLGLLILSVLPLLYKSWSAVTSLVGNGTLLTMIAFVIVGLTAGHLLGGPTLQDRSVLALACASRHPAIALAIATANFPNEKLVPAAILLYLLVSAIAVTPYLTWNKRQAQRTRHKPIMALR
jgi:BASS family bile acid:Na+ symporter